MAYKVPSAIMGTTISVLPSVSDLEDYTNLSFTVTVPVTAAKTLTFSAFLLPFFSIWVFMDQAGSVQIAARTKSSGAGSTYRNVGNAFSTTASQLFMLAGYRVSPALQVQVTLTNVGTATSTISEFAVYASSS